MVFDATLDQDFGRPNMPLSRLGGVENWWRDLTGTVTVTDRLSDVEGAWRQLEADGIDSPGQSFDMISAWTEAFDIAPSKQLYLVGSDGDQPVILLPLRRTQRLGVDMVTWFTGSHVGCNGPLLDKARLGVMEPAARLALWQSLFAQIADADLAFLPDMRAPMGVETDLMAGIGAFIAGDTLYRAEFVDWAQCDQSQRNRSRRKHDKQHAAKLAAIGEVTCQELDSGDATTDVLETMFAQRAARFSAQGISNPFEDETVQRFYQRAFAGGKDLRGKLHVLRLNQEIVAVRYNLVHKSRMFCLISSMSDNPKVQIGAPGKQCLLRAMQSVFDDGYSMFDMGAGLTDEKRVWCNRQLPLRTAYVPLSAKGRVFATLDRRAKGAKRALKNNQRIFAALKAARVLAGRFSR